MAPCTVVPPSRVYVFEPLLLRWPHESCGDGADRRLRFAGPAPSDAAVERMRDALLPLISTTLPGYGDGLTPARCVLTATHPVVWLAADGSVSGFAAMNAVCVRNTTCVYLTLAAMMPTGRRRQRIRTEIRRVARDSAASLVAATTNVPAVYRMLRQVSADSFDDQNPRVWPATDTCFSRPVPGQVHDLADEILRAALPGAQTIVDPLLVRRAYRERDLQATPAPRFFDDELRMARERQLDTSIARLFRDGLSLGVGDAAVVIAAVGNDNAGGVPWPRG